MNERTPVFLADLADQDCFCDLFLAFGFTREYDISMRAKRVLRKRT